MAHMWPTLEFEPRPLNLHIPLLGRATEARSHGPQGTPPAPQPNPLPHWPTSRSSPFSWAKREASRKVTSRSGSRSFLLPQRMTTMLGLASVRASVSQAANELYVSRLWRRERGGGQTQDRGPPPQLCPTLSVHPPGDVVHQQGSSRPSVVTPCHRPVGPGGPSHPRGWGLP